MIWKVPFNPESMKREVVTAPYHLKQEVSLVLSSIKGPMFQSYRKEVDSQLNIAQVRIFLTVTAIQQRKGSFKRWLSLK